MPQLTEWLKVMLSEIARKRDDAEQAREEALRRVRESGRESGTSSPTKVARPAP